MPATIHMLKRGPPEKVALNQIEIEKKLKPRLFSGALTPTGLKSVADLDGLVAGKIAPSVVGWLVLPIAAAVAVIGRTVSIGRSGERAEREAADHAGSNRSAPAAAIISAAPSVAALAAPIAAAPTAAVPTVAVPALCHGRRRGRGDAGPQGQSGDGAYGGLPQRAGHLKSP